MNILRPIQKAFYGDDSRWFLGTVINSNPPAGLEGRVKIRIHGVHNPNTDQIPERDLPWAQVLIPSTEGGSSGIGKAPQLLTGAFVFGMFLDGVSSQTPLILGSLPHVELPTDVQKGRVVSEDNKFNYDQKRLQNVVAEPLKQDLEINDYRILLRRQQAMKFFIDNGFSVVHSAAITGALEGASVFLTYDETNEEKVGIAQWRYNSNRFRELVSFAQNFQPNDDWQRFSIQLQFVLFELNNRFGIVQTKLLATSTLKEASQVVNKYYLKSSNRTYYLAKLAYNEVTYG
jgi:hypothetical protein